jgi:hypothetical protein
MTITAFNKFIEDLKRFKAKMNDDNIPLTAQRVLLEEYIDVYNIEHNSKIRLNMNNINLLIKEA